jgi:PAS domain S-box-containing protein
MIPLNTIKASKKLYLLVFVMAAFIVGVGWYGTRELKIIHQQTHTLYTDRLIPMEQLSAVRFAYAVGILSTAHQVESGEISFQHAEDQLLQAERTIASNWNAYMLTYLTPDEKERVTQAALKMQRAKRATENFKIALTKKEVGILDTVINNNLFPAVNPIIIDMNELMALQVSVSSEIYKEAICEYDTASKRFYILIWFSLICAVSFAFYVIGNIRRLIKDQRESSNKITQINERYRSLLEHAGDPIFLLNDELSFIEVNSSTTKLLGYSQEELLKMKIADVFAPGEIERLPLQLDLLLKNKALMSERKWSKKDGAVIDIEMNVRLLDAKSYLCIARDITERKRIEETVRESERKYRNIFENAQDVFYQASLTGILMDVSPSVENHLGYKREELIGFSVRDIYYDLSQRDKVLELVYKNGEVKDFELSFKSNTGEEVFVSLNARLIYDKNGFANHIDGMFRNITERKRMLEQLVENKEQLTLFIEHSPASLAMFDTEMRYIATSHRWLSDYNLERQQLQGKTHYETFPEMTDRWKEIHQRCLKGAIEKKEEDVFLKADGSKEWLRWEIHPWHKANGVIGGIIMFTEVITERKRATEMFKYQFENSPDIILVVNKYHKIEAINRTLPGGIPVEKLIGMDSIAILPERSQEITRAALASCFQTGKSQEIEIALRFGIWSRSRFAPIITDGVVSHVMIFSTDNTVRKRAELELEHTLLQLENRVRERTKELSDKNSSILDSIKYAKRIQVGLLTPPSRLAEIFPKSFMISVPCDIVSGDFFWSHEQGTKKFIIVADCTGHGVPGALMSIICNNLIDQIIINERIESPSDILELLDTRLKQAVKNDEDEVKDGMDITICVIDINLKEICYAGANNSLYVTNEEQQVQEKYVTHVSIGGMIQEEKKHFEVKRFTFLPGQRIYLSSDGYYSQFGGERGKKFMKAGFEKTLDELQVLPIEKHKSILLSTFAAWKGKNEQVDDVLVIGIEL